MAKAKSGKGKELAVKEDELAMAEGEAYGDSDGAAEDMSREDMAIPRLTILQSNSPACTKGDPARIEGAEPGHILDIVNGKLYDGEDGIIIVPINFRKTHIEWGLREEGGGFVADHGNAAGAELMSTSSKNDQGKDILPNGHQIVRTMEYVVYQLTEEEYHPCIISMSSTQIKYAQRLNTQLIQAKRKDPSTKKMVPAPIYYRAWKFGTQPEKNDKGSWWSWHISPVAPLSELEYDWMPAKDDWVGFAKECQFFRNQIKEDAVRFQPPPSQESGEGSNDGEDM